MKKILLLGHTGKMGCALGKVLSSNYLMIAKNSRDFDAENFEQVTELIDECHPDIIINTVAFLGIDACELEPERAQRLNTLFPGFLARLSFERGIMFVHFSTDAVFDDEKQDYFSENDIPSPLHLYGVTKYGGECLVRSGCDQHYIFRVPLLFGLCGKRTQFVEKMLELLYGGQKNIRVSTNLISSPTYSYDVATHVRQMLLNEVPFGTYHLANEGKVSLYELMAEIVTVLNIDATVERASFMDFPFMGRKNMFTPLTSVKTKNLRPWQEALRDYCSSLSGSEVKHG